MRKKFAIAIVTMALTAFTYGCGSEPVTAVVPTEAPEVTVTDVSTSTPEPTKEPSSVPTELPATTPESTETLSPTPTQAVEPIAEPTPTETPTPTPEPTPTETPTPTPEPMVPSVEDDEPSTPIMEIPKSGRDDIFLYYIDADGTCRIQGFVYSEETEKLTEVVIPKEFEGFPVVRIQAYAFWGQEALTSVIIPEGVKEIEDNAFGYCENLTSIVIPESVIFIDKNAFQDTENLININVIPDSYADKRLNGFSVISGWSGNYDSLVTEGFDHIKVPTIDSFYSEGLDMEDAAFDFGNRPEWEEVWYDAYDEFLVANGSPIIDDTPIGAFYAINPGYTLGYQYLYYGFRGDATNGWGDIVLLPRGLNSSMANNSNYDGAYVLETTNFFYGEMDKGLENEYRAATTMMLSWIVPNPQEVEKAIYEFHVDQVGNTILVKNVLENGFGSWVQVGDVDIAVVLCNIERETLMFAIRNHK